MAVGAERRGGRRGDPRGDERPGVTDERAGGSRVRTVFLGSGGFGRESLRRLAEHATSESGRRRHGPASPGRSRTGRSGDRSSMTTAMGPRDRPDPDARPPAACGRARGRPALSTRDSSSSPTTGRSCPQLLLGLPHGALNLHPSLLPRHRGATPIPATILAGDAETGVTLMRMDEGLDTGPIVAQAHVPLDGHETTPALEERLAHVAAGLPRSTISGRGCGGELDARPQPADGATLTRPLRRDDGRLDPRRSAAELERQVRAYQPWPGTFVDTAARPADRLGRRAR